VVEETSCGGIVESPAIVSALDVPSDNGGWVALSWKRSLYDSEGASPEVTRYKIWRRCRETLPPPALLGADPTIAGPFEHGLTGPAWEVVATVDATGGCCYEFQVPTHCDSGAAGDCWNRFCVTAHTGIVGEHFDSPVDSGYSVDNLGMMHLASGKKAGPGDLGEHDVATLEVPQPNPGVDGFRIVFSLASDDWVQLSVYDIRGRRVASIHDGFTQAGTHEVGWDPGSGSDSRLSPGLYFVHLVTTTSVETAKIMIL
jgi:hypothetical protein